MRKPDFDANLGRVLQKCAPERPTLFEFILSDAATDAIVGHPPAGKDPESVLRHRIEAFCRAGYDFVPVCAGRFSFPRNPHATAESYSLNDGGIISDRESFEAYDWHAGDPEDFADLDLIRKYLPDGMKILCYCPDGILENVIGLCGYETLCYLLADDRALVKDLFWAVGSRMERYLKRCAEDPDVGIVFCNDDWGFRTGTLISHADLREFVYPHYREVCRYAHGKGKFAAMHSCGNFDGIYEDLYRDIGFDGKHSNEDTILPVEQAYERYSGRIAVLGGIDIDFLCRATSSEIEERCKNMLRRSETKGGYALGSGNSIARYVPLANYMTLLRAANPDFRPGD